MKTILPLIIAEGRLGLYTMLCNLSAALDLGGSAGSTTAAPVSPVPGAVAPSECTATSLTEVEFFTGAFCEDDSPVVAVPATEGSVLGSPSTGALTTGGAAATEGSLALASVV